MGFCIEFYHLISYLESDLYNLVLHLELEMEFTLVVQNTDSVDAVGHQLTPTLVNQRIYKH